MGNDWELWAISKNSKHPEKAMELLNFLNSIEGAELIANGIKDKHWEENNGKPALKEDRIKAEQADPEFINKTGIKKYQNYLLHSLNVIDPKYNVPINFTPTIEYQKNNLTPLQKDYTAHYGVQLPNEATDKKVQSGQASYNSYNGLYYSLLPTNVPDDIKRIGDSLKSYIEKNIAKVILAKNDDEFAKAKQKMIDDLLKAGLQKHYDYWIAEYTKAKAEADTYTK